MATTSRREDTPLERQLFEESHRFDFFQAVRLLERLYRNRRPVGRDASPSTEVARFRSHASLTFPETAIREISRDDGEQGRPRVTVSFFGLTGPLGVLPRHYTQLLIDRARQKDRSLWDFLDVFVHRLVSLFYRAWEKYRFAISYERAQSIPATEDRFSRSLFDLFGMGAGTVRKRLTVPDEILLFYAGLLAQQPRSASSLRSLLRDYFAVPVFVEPFVGQWLRLSIPNRTKIGRRGKNHRLGSAAVLGSRCWDQQANFRLRIGPLDWESFSEYLPTGAAFPALVQLTRFFVGPELDFEVQLSLQAAEVPRCALGANSGKGPRLGWSAWLKTTPFLNDTEDTLLTGSLTRAGSLRDK